MTGNAKRPISVGLFIPFAEHLMAGETPRWQDLAFYAKEAESAGFDSLWVADHFLMPVRIDGYNSERIGAWESWSLVSALAATTSRIKIGTFVSCLGFRNPALLAKMADTVDEISGGRLILGLGAGWNEMEFDAFGFPFDHRASRFEESIAIVSGLLKVGEVDFEGTYHRARDCELRPRGPRPSGPPILIGTKRPRMLELCARYADIWNAEWYASADPIPALRQDVDAACNRVGREPASLERTLGLLIDAPGTLSRSTGVYSDADRLRITPPANGSAEELAIIRRNVAAEGISHVQVWLEPNTVEGIHAFAPVLDLLDA
ncbi:LLM class F420-dependent oxidoreductase [soil metagenome]